MKKILLLLVVSICITISVFAADVYVTVDGAGTESGADWDNAYDIDAFEGYVEGTMSAGDNIYVAGGTYTFTADFENIATDGTALAPIKIIGVGVGTTATPPLVGDLATGDARPLIAMGAFDLMWGDSYIEIQNFRITSTDVYGLTISALSTVINTESHNSSGTADRYALRCDTSVGTFINVDSRSENGYAIGGNTGLQVIDSYLHESKRGIYTIGNYNAIIGNVFDDMSDSCIYSLNENTAMVYGNTFHDCTTGISETTGYDWTVVNNIFDGSTAGVNWTADNAHNYFDYNVWDNTTDVTNADKGYNKIDGDPGFTDVAGEDFTVGGSSNATGAGQPLSNTSIVGDYDRDIGADHDDNTVAGGGTNANGSLSVGF